MSGGRGVLAAFAVALTGCRCGPLTDCHLDHVDRFNRESRVCLDHLYCPATDPTRVGRPDWCATVPPAMCRKECCTRVGVADVPEPIFRVYPQPPTKADTEGPVERSAEEELKSVVPPSPGD